MKFALIDAEKAFYPIAVLCAVLGVSTSGYYAWRARPMSARAVADVELGAEIAGAHKRGRGAYGSRRVHAELRARGRRVGKKRVERIMRDKGLQGRRKRRFCKTTDSAHDLPVAPNLLAREFDVEAPNTVWAGDVTYIPTAQGWLFLAVVLDLFSRRVVGFAMSDANDRQLALEAMGNAIHNRRPRAGLIHHSDRGSPYASAEYRALLASHGVLASMSRTGDCWDNAVVESFFATLKTELLDTREYATHEQARLVIADYIERFYNPTRRHSHLGYVSPIEFELRAQMLAEAA